VKLAAMGLSIGLLGAFGLARVLSASNPGMHFDNPFALAVPALLLVGVALIASWLPARRAARINPIDALRAE
jgi:ABC-type antimicrobial peptide transport system permease subunit